MSTNYPGAVDDNTSLPNPSSSSFTNNPSHAGLHDNENDAIKALETKVGTGASTPPGGGYILTSNSTGGSTWSAPPAAGVWGLITGTLSNQTDLQTALNAKLSLSGGTMTGNLILAGAPSSSLMAATKGYVDTMVPLAGGTMTGLLILSADPSNALGAATKQYVDALGSTTLVRNETPGGSINGSNVNFTTAATFGTGSLKVYLNGQRLAPGSGIDFVEITQGFTMQYAPATGDVLLVDYETTNTTRFIQGSNSIIVQETPTGTINGSTTLFTVLQGKYVANTLEVFLNGIQQTKTTDYTETSPGSGTFTFTTAPLTNDVLKVSYQFSTGASGNADTVDGIHASATPTANQLLALDSNALVPTAALGAAWTSYTPTWTNVTPGNATVSFKYAQIGKFVAVRASFIFGSTSSVSGVWTFSLPVTSISYPGTAAVSVIGTGTIYDVSAGLVYDAKIVWVSTTTAKFIVTNVSTYVVQANTGTTVPSAPANPDEWAAEFIYEAA